MEPWWSCVVMDVILHVCTQEECFFVLAPIASLKNNVALSEIRYRKDTDCVLLRVHRKDLKRIDHSRWMSKQSQILMQSDGSEIFVDANAGVRLNFHPISGVRISYAGSYWFSGFSFTVVTHKNGSKICEFFLCFLCNIFLPFTMTRRIN